MASDAMSNGFVLYLTLTETSTNPAANTSVVSYSLYINPPGNYQSFNLNSGDQSYSVTINGSVVASGGFTYDFRSPNENTNKVIKSGTVTIPHNADGSKTVAASGFANTASSTVGDGSIASFNTVLTNFVFVPEAPTYPTVTRSGSSVEIISSVPFSATTITDFEVRGSNDNSTWSSAVSMGSDGVYTESVTPTQERYYQTRAISSEGTGAWSSSGYIAGVPSLPSSIYLSRNARDVSISLGGAPNNGSVILHYIIRYSTDGGSTWTDSELTYSGSTTFTNLPAGLTYTFEGYAVNAIGSGSAVSASLFVPAGGKRYNGSTWVSTATAKRYNGSTWQSLTIAKRYNGTTWVDLS